MNSGKLAVVIFSPPGLQPLANFSNVLGRLLLIFLVQVIPLKAIAESYPFGRLFTNDSERRELDQKRRISQKPPEVLREEFSSPEVTVAIKEAPTKVKFSGYIRRSDGKYAIWIDGKSDLSNTHSDAVSVNLSATNPTAVFSSMDKQATLTPGQTWYPDQSLVKENYQEIYSESVKSPPDNERQALPNTIPQGDNVNTQETGPNIKSPLDVNVKRAIEAVNKAGIQLPPTPLLN